MTTSTTTTTTATTATISTEEILDAVNASRSSAEALVLTDEGELADDWHSEPADLSSEAAFRAQVAEWIEATR